MFAAVALLVLLSSPRASALMSKVSGSSLSAAAGEPAAVEGEQGLSRLSSLYDAFLIGELRAGIADRTASSLANEQLDRHLFLKIFSQVMYCCVGLPSGRSTDPPAGL